MQENGGISLIDWSGIPSTWKLGKLGDYCEIRRGASPRPAGDPRYFGGGIPWFKIGDATKNPGRFLTETAETVNEEGARRSVQIPAGSLIIANSGVSLGFAVFVGVTGCVHDGWLVLNNFNGIDDRYIFYCVNLLTNALRGMADGTTQPNLNTTIARNLLIPVPPIDEQRRIAETLWSLDDKIELNRRMNATLEAMARALFKAWFVDFEPVHANKENRPSTSASPEIAKLFPSTFENGIPKGWEAGTVGENFKLTMGRSPSGDTYNKDGRGEVFYQGRTDFGFRFPTPRVYCTQPATFAEKNDTLLSVRAPVGDVNIAPDRCCIGRGIAAVRHKSGSRSFTYYNLWNLASHFDNFESEGTVFGSITKVGLQNTKIVEPIPQIIETFEETVGKLDDRIETNSREIVTLSAIRDSLLPRLITGNLPVAVTT